MRKRTDSVQAIYKRRLPVVLTLKEVHAVFDHLSGVQRIMAMLIYGRGLRLEECLSLRKKDIDLEQNIVMVRSGKGDKDRRTIQELLDHRNIQTAMIYTHVASKNVLGVRSPLDE